VVHERLAVVAVHVLALLPAELGRTPAAFPPRDVGGSWETQAGLQTHAVTSLQTCDGRGLRLGGRV